MALLPALKTYAETVHCRGRTLKGKLCHWSNLPRISPKNIRVSLTNKTMEGGDDVLKINTVRSNATPEENVMDRVKK